MRGDTRISTPTNGSIGDERHDVIKVRGLCVRVHKKQMHYSRGNDILLIPYPTLHKLNVGIIGVDREV